jgi:hypothetical protein
MKKMHTTGWREHQLREVRHMRKKVKGIRITVLLILLFLSGDGASYLLKKGESYMEKPIYAAGSLAAKPSIDMKAPSRIGTATFALG